jgi:uncharacterized membrane protein
MNVLWMRENCGVYDFFLNVGQVVGLGEQLWDPLVKHATGGGQY